MTHELSGDDLVLAIHPSVYGFGYALLEGPLSTIDWGLKGNRSTSKDKNAVCLDKIEELIHFHKPQVIVIENYDGPDSRRHKRIRKLIDEIARLGAHLQIPVCAFSRADIRFFFKHYKAQTKEEIAKVIVEWLPEFELHLPPKRKPWMSEDPRLNIFDAVSLALTFFYKERSK